MKLIKCGKFSARLVIELEPPTPMIGDVYLGCGQNELTPEREDVLEQSEQLRKVLAYSLGDLQD